MRPAALPAVALPAAAYKRRPEAQPAAAHSAGARQAAALPVRPAAAYKRRRMSMGNRLL